MAASSQGDDDGIISGINVTPLVDITLVLLIVFMVTAKIIVTQGMPLDLPKSAAGQETQLLFSVELRANGDTFVDGTKKLPNDEAVLPLAKEALAKRTDLRAVINAETTVQHGRVIAMLALLDKAGIKKVAFGTQGGKPKAPAAATTEATAAPAPAPAPAQSN